MTSILSQMLWRRCERVLSRAHAVAAAGRTAGRLRLQRSGVVAVRPAVATPAARPFATAAASGRAPKAAAAAAAAPASATTAGAAPLPFYETRAKDIEETRAQRPDWTPYPSAVKPTASIADFVAAHRDLSAGEQRPLSDGQTPIVLVGRVLSKRESSNKLVFYDLHSAEHRVQVVASKKAFADDGFALNRILKRGDIVAVSGHGGRTKTGELSVFASSVTLLAPCLHDLPLRLVDNELRYRQRYLDWLVRTAAPPAPAAAATATAPSSATATASVSSLSTTAATASSSSSSSSAPIPPSAMAAFVQRARVISGIRKFLDARGFVEVETPILWPKHGGAAARPFVTHSRVLGADLPLHMRVAPELFLKQLVIGGLERVYELGKVFRNEGIDNTHNPEFTSCEFYAAHSTYADLMPFTEQLLRDVVSSACGGALRVPLPVVGGSGSGSGSSSNGSGAVTIDFSKPFQRLDIMQTLKQQLKVTDLPDPNDPAALPQWRALCKAHGVAVTAPFTNARVIDKLIGAFIEPLCTQPTFLLHHPVCMSPLARAFDVASPQRGLTQRFELFVGGAELCNAYSELNDPHEQRRRLLAQAQDAAAGDDEAQLPDEDFCVALEHGLPPTAGWGLGVDRLCMLLAGTPHIRDVLLFPIMKPAPAAAVPPAVAAL